MRRLDIKELLSEFHARGRTEPADCALWHLLVMYEDKLPELDGYFHKAFRQVDVTGNGHADMAIYNLLHHTEVFWQIWEELESKPREKRAAKERRA